MPKIKVKLFANLREFTGTKEVELEGETVRDVLELLCEKFPGLENMLFEGGNVRPFINILLNGKDIRGSGGLGSSLGSNDEVAIFPPVSGGRCSRKE